MKQAYSLDSLATFVKDEKSELEKVGLHSSEKVEGPSELCIQTILGFSKQLS